MTVRRFLHAVIRLLLTLVALYVAIILPDMFMGLGEIVEAAASIILAVMGCLLLFYLWYPNRDPTASTSDDLSESTERGP